jgi:mannan endo-1,6-alpha-mannosidase
LRFHVHLLTATAIANACFFNIGARIARYTGNETYARIAEETWDWVWDVNYIDHETWLIYDGGHVEHNCTDVNKLTFSYNPGIFLQGAAHLWNMTEDQKWADRIDNMLDSMISRFFFDDVIFEWQCEGAPGHCSPDMLMFKGFVVRWLAQVTQLAPWTAPKILPILRTTTEAAIGQCTGGATGRVCGFYWTTHAYVDPAVDHTSGAGEALNVLSAVSTLLIESADPPATASTGGISEGDVNAGPRNGDAAPLDREPITSADRAGAIILTILVVAGAIGTFVWMTYFD